MTTPPSEAPRPLVAPTVEETRAITNASGDDEIRALAQQLVRSASLGFDPTQILKGIITAVNAAGTPPTVSIQVSGDTTTTVTGVRLMNNYSPVVGQTVNIGKQGSDIVVLGHTADVNGLSVGAAGSGWIKATLAAGSHGGNSNGDVYYRRILDHGSWKMQWRGGWTVSGTVLIASGGLATEYRPSSRRSVLAARQIQTGGVSVQFDFNTDGQVGMVGDTTTPYSAGVSGDIGSVDPFDNTTSVDPIDDTTTAADGHWHGVIGSHSHGVTGSHDHAFYGGSHSHQVATPAWVSLNGVEYFL